MRVDVFGGVLSALKVGRISGVFDSPAPGFTDPSGFRPYTFISTKVCAFDSASVQQTVDATAFHTEMARRGLQDTTNWTADTYKTILSVASGPGEVAFMCGPQAGGVATTTFEITGDRGTKTVAVTPLASGERALLVAPGAMTADAFYTTSSAWLKPIDEALKSDKATWQVPATLVQNVLPWHAVSVPLFTFKNGVLLRMKHSASITNSTATAYASVMYRLKLTA